MSTATVLTAFLNADTTKFTKGMRAASKNSESFGKQFKKIGNAVGVAISALVIGLGALTARQMGVIDETAKLSKALGVNIREFQALAFAASEAGITQDQLGNMITKSQRSIVEASRGLQTYARSFETLGLDVKELMKLRPDQQFDEIAIALTKIESPTLRTATALELFGRSGRQVINMLDGYVEKVQEAREFNDKWGVSLSNLDASKVEEANDTFARVGVAISGLGNIMAVKFAPMITYISELFLQSGLDGEFFGNAVQGALEVAGGALDIFRKAWIGLKMVIAGVVFTTLDLTEKLTKSLYGMGEGLASILNHIPGVSVQANETLRDMATSIGYMRDAAGQTVQEMVAEAKNFEKTAEKISKIEMRANERALANGAGNENQGLIDTIGLMEEKEKQSKKNKKATEDENKVAKDLGRTMSSSFEEAITSGEKLGDVLGSLLDDIEKILLRRVVTEPLDGFITDLISGSGTSSKSSGGGSSGGGFLDGIGSFVGDLFSGITPFAVGTNNVPKDMIAQVHKGEMIVPAYDAQKMRNGGGGGGNVNVIINNNSNSSVTTSSKDNGDGTQLNIMIDQAVADNMSRKGTRTNQALNSQLNQTRIKR